MPNIINVYISYQCPENITVSMPIHANLGDLNGKLCKIKIIDFEYLEQIRIHVLRSSQGEISLWNDGRTVDMLNSTYI